MPSDHPVPPAINALSDFAREALRISESRYRRLFESAQDGILLLNADTAQIEDVNPYLIHLLGYSHAEFLGKKLWEVGSFADIVQSKEMFAELQTKGYVRYKDLPLKTKAGTQIAVEFVSNTYDCEGIKVIQCNIRNISERKADHAKIQRHTQLYVALSQCNKAIVHSTSEEGLLLQICRAAVQFGGMKMAWVGLVDTETLMVRPVASFGDGAAYLQDIQISADAASPFGQGPMGTSIRKNQPFWCQDFMNDPLTAPWQERGARFGWGALASLPLHRNDVVIGTFVLYAGETNAFDEAACELLVEMAKDISFALDNFARESQRKRTEEEIKFKNTILLTQQETSLDAILVVDENGQIISYNQQFIDLWRLSPQLVSARLDAPVFRSVVDQVENPEAFVARVQYLYEHRGDKSREEVQLKDGRIIDRYSAPITGADDKYYGRVWYFRDITERKRVLDELSESERRFSNLLGNIEMVSMMLDTNARITYCNDYLLRLTGWLREEVIGQNWFELFIPPKIDDLKDVFTTLLTDLPKALHHENEILTRSGERRLIRWNNSVLRSGAGDVIGTASIGEDITERKRYQEALRQNEERTRLILESVGDGIHGIDIEGRIIFENPAAAKLLGYSIEELSGRPAHATMHYSRKDGTPYPIEHCPIHATIHDGVVRRVEDEVFWRKDGSSFPVEYTTAPIRNDRGDITGVVVAFQDITDRKEAENRIRRLNRVYAVLSRINTLIVHTHDRDELFREACQIAIEAGTFRMAWIGVVDTQAAIVKPVAFGGDVRDFFESAPLALIENKPGGLGLVGRAVRDMKPLISNDVLNDPQRLMKKEMRERGINSLAVIPLIVGGEAIGVIALYSADAGFFDDNEMRLLLELAGDIAFAIDHIDKQERLDYLAYYDELTGLANRSLFLERVAQYMRSAVSSGHKLAVFFLDLERFKNINDSLGRPAGDALLKQVSEWLSRDAGDPSMLARLGADHFAIVVPELEQEGNIANLLEKKMRVFLDHTFRLNDTEFRIAIKVGGAIFPEDGVDADTLFKNAEAALKRAKASGDPYLFYTQKMTESVAGKLNLENQLRRAIDNEEFVLHYQPKVNLVSGKVTSAEALIRWNDPRTGLVPPGQFIPILEETGLIYEVGRWALHKAIADYLRWRAAGLVAVRIAVNVSPLQLRNPGFIAEIKQAIGIDAHASEGLELEITESLIMSDVKHSIASLQAIRAMGVTIAIDDFGTGFSSLSYLAKLPVDTLKIDRSFVIDMTAGPEGLALVSTIIGLAHSLNLKVVAEGVETEEQSRLLRLLRCGEMQGFLFSKPVPSEIFEARFLTTPPIG